MPLACTRRRSFAAARPLLLVAAAVLAPGARAEGGPLESATGTRAADWSEPLGGVDARVRAGLPPAVDVFLRVHERYGTLRWLKPRATGARLSSPLAKDAAAVLAWLDGRPWLLGLDSPRAELKLLSAQRGEYFVFQQVHDDVDVPAGRASVLLDEAGRVRQVTAQLAPSFELEVAPRVSRARAIDVAERFAGASRAARLFASTASLVVDIQHERPHLAWDVRVGFVGRGVLVNEIVTVDARDGRVLGRRTLVAREGPASCTGVDWAGREVTLGCYEEAGATYLVDAALAPADVYTVDAENREDLSYALIAANGRVFDHVNGVSAASNVTSAFRYLQDALGRSTWDEGSSPAGATFTYANWGFQHPNAFATIVPLSDGSEASLVFLGNGDGVDIDETSACLDIVGHELFHNVVAKTAPLAYAYESGALNEHVADAFGTAIDKRYEDGDDLIGESCAPGAAAALRDLSSPTRFGQPAHLDDYWCLSDGDANDWGGVHINSGIPNHAFYRFYSARGVEAAEQVWYRALTSSGLLPHADFADFTSALMTSCETLSYDAAVCADLEASLAAVGMTPTATPACDLVPSGGCPAGSTQYGQYCYCDDGYVPSASGSTCEPLPCPANAHREGAACVCDDGYVTDPGAADGGCMPEPQCPPFSTYDDGACYCIAGFVVNAQRTACVPGGAGCGDETWQGRCEDDRYLVYCDTSSTPTLRVVDCPAYDRACSYDGLHGYYDCVVDDCGDVTYDGACAGDTLKFCWGSILYEVDCAAYAETCALSDEGVADCAAPPAPADDDAGPQEQDAGGGKGDDDSGAPGGDGGEKGGAPDGGPAEGPGPTPDAGTRDAGDTGASGDAPLDDGDGPAPRPAASGGPSTSPAPTCACAAPATGRPPSLLLLALVTAPLVVMRRLSRPR